MFGRNRVLPSVRLYSLTWTIAPVFGGMTNAMLQRSTACSEIGRRRVDILTLAPDLDPLRRERELREEGRLGRRVRLRNLWSDLRQASDRELARMTGTVREPEAVDDELLPPDGGVEVERRAEDGAVLQVDRYRGDDGSLLASDRRDTRQRGIPGGRRITLFSRKGTLLAQWPTATAFYHAWLDWVTEGKDSVILSDSSFVGGLMHGYRRDHATLVQVLHSSHLSDPNGSVHGPLMGDKKQILSHLDRYDLVTTLTEAQRDDLLAARIGVDNVATVSNGFSGTTIRDIEPRDPGHGTMVTRLIGLKRVDHAIRAAGLATARVPGLRLDIHGDGAEEDELRRLLDELGTGGSVTLKGYDPHAKEAFQEASFSLLTSRHEGQGLVILESMAAGCIPIAYDVKYGPASIITHGEDGFLVPAGDVEALARTIERITSMDPDELARMRQAAVRRAGDYSPDVIVRRWEEVLAEARRDPSPARGISGRVRLAEAVPTERGIRIAADLTGLPDGAPAWAMLSWTARGKDVFGRSAAEISAADGAYRITGLLPAERLAIGGEGLLDVSADARVESAPCRWRIAAGQVELPVRSGGIELYETAHGNLSVRVPAAES